MPAEARELSVVVPTYKEVLNLPGLLKRLEMIKSQFDRFEVLISDDDSGDGSEEKIAELNLPWVRMLVRKQNRGLSPAVIEGIEKSKYATVVVMDADLSHPPEVIPEMVRTLYSGDTDFVVGSRYVKGGSIDQDWSFLRSVNSWGATLLARPFASIKDPMSGFFSLRRSTFLQARNLNPIGYKIGLELIVKCNCRDVKEVPIHFADRVLGESKLSLKEQLKYLRHIKRLADYKFGNASFFAQFAVVGGLGVIVQMTALTLLVQLDLSIQWAVALSILTAMTSNFALNRVVTFSGGAHGNLLKQYVSFVGACSLGAFVNYAVTMGFIRAIPELEKIPQLPSLAGILAGMLFNFILSRYFVFKNQATPASKD